MNTQSITLRQEHRISWPVLSRRKQKEDSITTINLARLWTWMRWLDGLPMPPLGKNEGFMINDKIALDRLIAANTVYR